MEKCHDIRPIRCFRWTVRADNVIGTDDNVINSVFHWMPQMRITFGLDDSPERRRQFAAWWRANGLAHCEAVGPIRVDNVRRTITFSRIVDDAQPGDPEFPELRRDIENNPLIEETAVPLLVDPPAALWTRWSESQVA